MIMTPEELEQKRLEEEAKAKEEEDKGTVSKKEYLRVSSDMHKYKTNMKKLEDQLAEMNAKLEAKQNEELAEKQEWEKLYQKEKQSKEEILNTLKSTQQEISYAQKLKKVETFIGGFGKSEYSNLFRSKIEAIESDEDIEALGNEIRQNYSDLLKAPKRDFDPTAPKGNGGGNNPELPKDWDKLSMGDKDAYIREQLLKNRK